MTPLNSRAKSPAILGVPKVGIALRKGRSHNIHVAASRGARMATAAAADFPNISAH
jgi:hypothetical protein